MQYRAAGVKRRNARVLVQGFNLLVRPLESSYLQQKTMDCRASVLRDCHSPC